MCAINKAAAVLIAVGIVGVVYGFFSHTRARHEVKVGPIEFSVKEKETSSVPIWLGVGAIVIGGGMLLCGKQAR